MTSLVVGAGISGIAAAKFLTKLNREPVTLSDTKPLDIVYEKELLRLGVKVVSGNQQDSLLNNVNQIILSPGIPPDIPLIRSAQQKNIPVMSEIDLALENFSGTVIGVTGTNGKSTTTAMTAHVLQRMGKLAIAAGNIGRAPCDVLFSNEQYDYWVLELSSYQLETSRKLCPRVAMFTSFSEDHLKRHKTLPRYFEAKWHLITSLQANGLALLSPEAFEFMEKFGFAPPKGITLKVFGAAERFQAPGMPFSTKHDFINASFACTAVGHLLGEQDPFHLMKYLKDFETLPYRYKTIGFINGQQVINDSKSTNVDAVICALENILKPAILLLGGQGKGESFAPITRFSGKIKKAICFGESGSSIQKQLGSGVKTELVANLAEVLEELVQSPNAIDAPLLFSPGCASFDEFKNFEDRGRFFDKKISKLLET